MPSQSGLPTRAERQQHHPKPELTVVAGGGSSITKALQRARQDGHLKLQGRSLHSLPDEVWDIATVELPNNTNWWETRETLEIIDASQNEIASLPDFFANKLDQLREFNLKHNALATLPPAQSWCELAGLVNLSLGHNQLRSLPDHFGTCMRASPTRLALSEPSSKVGSIAHSARVLTPVVAAATSLRLCA